ncbi:MAG TPA: AraC family ligand binding domain-containing protein, partial [Chitinophagaceae bacterium]|nr:AraC family ligand binding domain-containing protein [Chitinophagaceae bacterium]
MKAPKPATEFSLWRHEHLFNIEFAAYTLSHHSFPRHFHDHYVIELVLEGADSFYCDGKNYVAADGQLVLINPGEVHTGSTIDDTTLRYFSFYPGKKALEQIAETLHINLPADLNFRETLQNCSSVTGKIRSLFDSLHSGTGIAAQQEYFFDCMQELLKQPEKTGMEF